MRKTLLWSTAVLGMLVLTGCGNSNSSSTDSNHEKTEQSSEEKVDTSKLMDEAKQAIDDKKFYEAKDKLETVQKEENNNKQVTALLNQINHYQQAEDKMSDEKYKEANQLLDQVKDEKQGSSVMKDYANKLSKEANSKLKKQTESSTEKKNQKDKNETSSKNVFAKNLTTQEKESINQAMVNWCKSQASKGGMAISESGFITPRGYNENSSYAVKTVDGMANIDLGTQTAGHDLNVVGYTTFYTPGNAGTSNDRGIGEGVSPNTIVDRYIWCDNGKVYELKAKFNGEESDSVLQGWYALVQDDELLEREDDVTFQASEDKAAITKYHSLLEEYGVSSDSNKTSQHTAQSKNSDSVSWNSDQEQDLNDFMTDWADEMGQSYVPGEIDTSHNYVKMGFQTWCKKEDYQEACSLVVPEMNGTPLDYTCGQYVKNGQYQVVSCYGPDPKTIGEEDSENRHYYVFTIQDGKPIVLNADDSQEVKPTANQALQKGFEEIVNG